MKNHPIATPLAWLLCVCGWAVVASAAPPTSYFKPGVPDFDQRPVGDKHCSPTAAANSLTWFDQTQGYDVVPDNHTDSPSNPNAHNGLITKLGNDMNTSGGTWNDDMVKGYRKYLRANGGGHQWDVKFQGTKYFRGYTTGSKGNTVNLDWIKQELADGEDVTLTVDWYRETSPGVYSGPLGAHSITLDGYTSGGANSDLLIRDPWYAEGIVERDTDAAGRLMYNYSTGSANLRAEIVGAISVSPKPIVVVVDSFFDIFEYDVVTPIGPSTQYTKTYGDYVQLGLDMGTVLTDLNPENGDKGTIVMQGQGDATGNGLVLEFNSLGLLNVLQFQDGLPIPIPNENKEVQFAYGFDGNARTEMFIDRDLFGNFNVDSFFDITYQIDLDGIPTEIIPMDLISLTPQQVDIFPQPGEGPPFANLTQFEIYPDLEPIPFDPFEQFLREDAIGGIFAQPGDFNGDGAVDAEDIALVLGNWGYGVDGDPAFPAPPGWSLNWDGFVDANEYAALLANWGAGVGIASGGTNIPEPATMTLLTIVGLATLRRRRS